MTVATNGFKVSTILPKFDNDGNSIAHLHNAIVDSIATVSGGVTVFDVNGIWLDNGTRYIDSSVMVVTFCDTDSKVTDIKSIVTVAKDTLKQLAMFFEVIPVYTDFI